MLFGRKCLALATTLAALAGCAHDKPHAYRRDRPPVDEVDPGDKGLQSADVVSASDQMAAKLLSLPALNASQTQWTIVVDRVENQTTDRGTSQQNFQIFLARLKTKLFEQGQGRVQLIENRDEFYKLRGRELEGPGRDEFGQGAGGGQPAAPGAIQPDFSLYAKISDLPNRSTVYYYLEFALTNLRDRRLVWQGGYEVRARR